MLIDLPAKIKCGDIVVDGQGRYFLVVKNTFDPHFTIALINLQTNRVEDEFYSIDYISESIHTVGVIPGEELEIRRVLNDKSEETSS